MIRFLQQPGPVKKIVLGGLLVIVCVMMVITLVPGGLLGDFLNRGSLTTQGVLAKVGDQEITVPLVRQQARLMGQRLLAQMLNVGPEAIVWETELRKTIEFTSDQQFASDLQGFIASQQEKYRGTAAALMAKGLITSAEQEYSLPGLDIHLSDMRGPGYSALPRPSHLPARVWIDNPWH